MLLRERALFFLTLVFQPSPPSTVRLVSPRRRTVATFFLVTMMHQRLRCGAMLGMPSFIPLRHTSHKQCWDMDAAKFLHEGGYMSPKEHLKFDAWRDTEHDAVSQRGAVPNDFQAEQRYVQGMSSNVLRAYICHKEVDVYTQCLLDKKIVREEDLNKADVNLKMAKEKCAKPVAAYLSCVENTRNYETVVQCATEHPRCGTPRRETFQCMERYADDKEQQGLQCRHVHLSLVRCGMNHLWDEYWRAITGFGVEEELHLYDMQKQKAKHAAAVTMGQSYTMSKRGPT